MASKKKMAHMALEEVIAKKGTFWDDHSQLILACEFINKLDKVSEFRQFLNEMADEENKGLSNPKGSKYAL